MKSKKPSQSQLYKDFLSLYEADKVSKRKTNKISKAISKDFEKIIAYEKTRAYKMRSKIKKEKPKKGLVISRQSKQKVDIKDTSPYTSIQKDFFLPKPLKVNAQFLNSSAFYFFLVDNFYTPLKLFFEKNYKKKKTNLVTIGYHFFFDKKGNITNQSGFRSPRLEYDVKNYDDIIQELFTQTFTRFDAYFKTRNKSQLYFEGITGEISYL